MPKLNAQAILNDLQKRTEFCLTEAKKMRKWKSEKLNHQPTGSAWSAAQCVVHLNNYGEHYIPLIEVSIQNNNKPSVTQFTPGFIGNMFANAMMHKPNMTKMGAPVNMAPKQNEYNSDVIDTFIDQQKQLLELIQQACEVNVNASKVNVTISKFVKLKLADIMRVVIYHNERHIYQAIKAAKQ